MNLPQLRRAVSSALDPAMRKEPGLSPANTAITCLILVSAAVAVLETEEALSEPYAAWFTLFEVFVFAVFGVEYVLRIWSCIENPEHRSRMSYARRLVPMIDLSILVVMAFGFVGFEGVLLRLFRLARLLRIARLGQFSKAVRNMSEALAERKFELLLSVFLAFGLLLGSSSALYLIEGGHQPEIYGSIPRAMWWSVATLTTVGYGDAVPITPLGKFFASLTALTGVGLIAMPAGILASAFSSAIRRSKSKGG